MCDLIQRHLLAKLHTICHASGAADSEHSGFGLFTFGFISTRIISISPYLEGS